MGIQNSRAVLTARTTTHACNQIRLDVDFKEDDVALESAMLDLDIAKLEYSSKKKEAKEHPEEATPSSKATSPVIVVKMTYKKAVKAKEAAKLAVTMAGAKAL